WRMPRYAAAIATSQPFSMGPEDAAALVGNRLTAEMQAWAYGQLVPESGRAAREMALGRITLHPAGIRCPTLVGGAEDDQTTPAAAQRKIAARYGSEYVEAKGHAPLVMLEEGWERPFAEVLAWLSRVVRS